MLSGFLSGATQPEDNVRPVVPVNQRAAQMEAMVLAFVAEKDLPFTVTSGLLELMKAAAKDKKALGEVKLQRRSASYKMVHGVAKTFTGALTESLKQTKFSLNIDESTTKSQKKVLAVLVSFFDEQKNEIVVEHLDSFEVVRADAKTIYDGIVNIFEKHSLPWRNLMSILMDSCNTMRGTKGGVETLIRTLKAPHLLDINRDSVHHAHNAAKAFCAPFENWLERLFKDIHTDFHWSTDLREKLAEICDMVGIKFTIPERFLNHRFLSAYNLAADTLRLLDALTIFYVSFAKGDDRIKFDRYKQKVIRQKNVSGESLKKLEEIDLYLKKKPMTVDGKERKVRIINRLFRGRLRTRLLLSIYVGVLHQLKEYVMVFQRKDPHIHLLNDKQIELLKLYLGLFIKPECMPKCIKQLKTMSVNDASLHLPPKSMFVGNSALLGNGKATSLSDVKIVLGQLKTAYVSSSQVLIQKMPIDNPLLKHASALDPQAQEHSIILGYLKGIPNIVTNVLGKEERSKYDMEVHRYISDPTLPPYDEGSRVDSWWGEVAKTYPGLGKLALACLSCFHGPLIDGVFNSMGDVCDVRSGSMNTETLSAIQSTKYHLKASGLSAVKYFERPDTLYSPVQANIVQNMKGASADYRKSVQGKKEPGKAKPVPKRTALDNISSAAKRHREEHLAMNVEKKKSA